MKGAATFSPCGLYRYTLEREISPPDPLETTVKTSVAFLMLNPSVASAEIDDPTVAKCSTYARLWGYSKLIVVNLFAYRSTNPKVLAHVEDPVGPDNDSVIMGTASLANQVICAWGRHGKLNDRGKIVTGMLRQRNIPLYCLKINKDGSPVHPLYMRLDEELKTWHEADEYGCAIH